MGRGGDWGLEDRCCGIWRVAYGDVYGSEWVLQHGRGGAAQPQRINHSPGLQPEDTLHFLMQGNAMEGGQGPPRSSVGRPPRQSVGATHWPAPPSSPPRFPMHIASSWSGDISKGREDLSWRCFAHFCGESTLFVCSCPEVAKGAGIRIRWSLGSCVICFEDRLRGFWGGDIEFRRGRRMDSLPPSIGPSGRKYTRILDLGLHGADSVTYSMFTCGADGELGHGLQGDCYLHVGGMHETSNVGEALQTEQIERGLVTAEGSHHKSSVEVKREKVAQEREHSSRQTDGDRGPLQDVNGRNLAAPYMPVSLPTPCSDRGHGSSPCHVGGEHGTFMPSEAGDPRGLRSGALFQPRALCQHTGAPSLHSTEKAKESEVPRGGHAGKENCGSEFPPGVKISKRTGKPVRKYERKIKTESVGIGSADAGVSFVGQVTAMLDKLTNDLNEKALQGEIGEHNPADSNLMLQDGLHGKGGSRGKGKRKVGDGGHFEQGATSGNMKAGGMRGRARGVAQKQSFTGEGERGGLRDMTLDIRCQGLEGGEGTEVPATTPRQPKTRTSARPRGRGGAVSGACGRGRGTTPTAEEPPPDHTGNDVEAEGQVEVRLDYADNSPPQTRGNAGRLGMPGSPLRRCLFKMREPTHGQQGCEVGVESGSRVQAGETVSIGPDPEVLAAAQAVLSTAGTRVRASASSEEVLQVPARRGQLEKELQSSDFLDPAGSMAEPTPGRLIMDDLTEMSLEGKSLRKIGIKIVDMQWGGESIDNPCQTVFGPLEVMALERRVATAKASPCTAGDLAVDPTWVCSAIGIHEDGACAEPGKPWHMGDPGEESDPTWSPHGAVLQGAGGGGHGVFPRIGADFSSGSDDEDGPEPLQAVLAGLGEYSAGPRTEEEERFEERYDEKNWHSKTWSLLPRNEFTGPPQGSKISYSQPLTPLQSFLDIWSGTVQRRIVKESNAYADWIDPKTGKRKGGGRMFSRG
ncbi:hypothetical protein M758_6G147900 [Ceratodon purpureus]|nr:hypothetical protein M758_6G147900 [Ceratodon purpureus]